MFEKSFYFLNLLKKNNNREWYHNNKKLFQDAKQEFESFTEILLHEVSQFDNSIAGLQPKDCIFRIFRDVRFSADKSPYKTNFGAFLTPGGRKKMNAGYYLHIEPGASLIASGIYQPPTPVLNAIRRDIYTFTEEFKTIIQEEHLTKLFGDISGEKLKNPPRGFPKDFIDIELLKYKNYGLIRMENDREMMKTEILQKIITCFKVSFPFVKFLNEAIKNMIA